MKLIKKESNFLMDQLHIKLQLANIRVLLDFVDSKFSLYLEKNESSNMYFCFRWILILFKREFTFPDIMRLWEILWTDFLEPVWTLSDTTKGLPEMLAGTCLEQL